MPDYARYRTLRVEKADRVATVTLNRPDVLNAIDGEMHRELEDVWLDLNEDPEVQAVVLTGAGRAFSAGGDIQGMARGDYHPLERPTVRLGRRIVLNLLEVEAPVIAALNGDAVGLGATLALFCDVIIADERARIGDPHVRVGLVAGDGGAVIWPLLCGVAKAKEYLMTGDLLSAQEAERIGLINRVVPAGRAYEEAVALARRLAHGPTWAIRWTKFSVNKVVRHLTNLVLDTSLALESLTFLTEDHREAVRAFLEKRPPAFRGR